MQKQFLYHNKKISYTIAGEENAPVVVLLHGFGENRSIWKNQLETLKDFRLIIPDIPGSGQSEMIENMRIEGIADALFHHMNHEISALPHSPAPHFTLIGHSMGGYITLAFAEKYPDMLNGFGLFHSTAYADSPEKVQTRKKGIAFIQKHGPFEFLKTSIPNLYSPLTRERHPSLIKEHLDSVHNFSEAALVMYYESMIERPDRVNILKNSTIPVLFILGKHDTAVPLKDGLEQCFLPSLSYIHVLDESAHMGMIEEQEKTNEILLNYLLSIDHQTP